MIPPACSFAFGPTVGSELRELAPDYEVAHTTLVPYFDRPEVAKQLSQPARQLQAERRAAAARRSLIRATGSSPP